MTLLTVQGFNPIALQLGPFSIHWYGVLIGLGIFTALYLGIREGKKHGIQAENFLDLVLYGVPAGIIGGRIYYVIFEWGYYSQNPLDIIAIWKGGLAIHGVLIASVITLILFCRARGLHFWRMTDIVAPSIIVAQAIGRWGNFMNQEAHGGVVTRDFLVNLRIPEFVINNMYFYSAEPVKVDYGSFWNFITLNPISQQALTPGSYYHHPTFLYESLWNILGFVVLISIRRLKLKVGEIFFSYLAWYSFGRFFIEALRTDSLMLTDTIRVAQLISVILIVISISAIIYRRVKMETENYYKI